MIVVRASVHCPSPARALWERGFKAWSYPIFIHGSEQERSLGLGQRIGALFGGHHGFEVSGRNLSCFDINNDIFIPGKADSFRMELNSALVTRGLYTYLATRPVTKADLQLANPSATDEQSNRQTRGSNEASSG